MKPTTTTDDTILLGAWVADDRAAITGALRSVDGALRTDVLAVVNARWPAMRQALEAAQVIGPRHVLLLTNDVDLKQALSRPFKAPEPEHRERLYLTKTEYLQGGWGGDADHWAVLCLLGGVWGGCFNVQLVDDLPGARELWSQQ